MWKKMKRRTAWLRALTTKRAESVHGRDSSFSLELPNPYGGPAWAKATLVWSTQPRGVGKTIRIRGHLDHCLRLSHAVAGQRLAHEQAASDSAWARRGRQAIATWAQGAIERLPRGLRRRLSEQRRRGWVDIQLSTAPLDAGAAALMPEQLRQLYGDKLPQLMPGGPRVGVWAGPAGGPNGGLARLAMVQLDAADMGRQSRLSDEERFSINFNLAEVVEPAPVAEQR